MNGNCQRTGLVPSIRAIQETLVELDDKPSSFVGSRQWIGSFEVMFIFMYDFFFSLISPARQAEQKVLKF